MVPLRAASREKGAAPAERNEGGSTREYGPAVRRLLERRPERLPLVGDRPAGAVSGEGLEMPVLILVGLVMVRREAVVDFDWGRTEMGETAGLALGLVLMMKLAGLKMTSLVEPDLRGLTRLANMRGSTFSASSFRSRSSAFRLPADEGDGRAVRVLVELN
jgi:hypothetical protein